ncbi:hypothetical protein GQ55_5G384300 [Panicum hallii var. hallii]|uniref:Uncharacterized protein n=1 Tax=Panicum hallii var. hallii TaxID=1504633 RepID=A0A2T7DMV8_9POAL|nr:hypothetical protein GQ55_5G384300 [Panicum hallii var. hallii]
MKIITLISLKIRNRKICDTGYVLVVHTRLRHGRAWLWPPYLRWRTYTWLDIARASLRPLHQGHRS